MPSLDVKIEIDARGGGWGRDREINDASARGGGGMSALVRKESFKEILNSE